MFATRMISGVALCIGVLTITACGGGNGVKVTGVVLMDGEPVPKASVGFVPDGSGKLASGFTDDNGRFVMFTDEEGDGVQPGKYKVTITAAGPPPEGVKTMSQIMSEKYQGGGNPTVSSTKDAQKLFDKMNREAAKSLKKQLIVPELYNDYRRTPFTADVPAITDYKFEVKKDVK